MSERAENKRSPATGGDPNNNIAIFYSPLPQCQCARALLVFRAFHAAIKRSRAAGNYSLHKIGGRAKSRRNFAPIEDPNAPAASSADIKQAATIPQRFTHHFNRPGKVRSCSTQRILHKFFF